MDKKKFRVFNTKEEAEKWGREQLYSALLSADEKDIIGYYTGSWFRAINNYLALGEHLLHKDPEMEEEISVLDELLSRHRIPNDIVVYRSTSKTWLELQTADHEDLKTCRPFWSTSLLSRYALRWGLGNSYWYLEKIYVPAGSPGLFVSGIYDKNDLSEYEVLLPRTTNFKVINQHLFGHYIELMVDNK